MSERSPISIAGSIASVLKLLLIILVTSAVVGIIIFLSQSNPSNPLYPSHPPVPISQDQSAPALSAKSIFVIDPDSQIILYSKNADEHIYPASTTKMMTALVAIDHYSLDQQITVAKSYPEGQDTGFAPGEVVSVENLLYALLVNSANDAAEILAENYPGGRPAFIATMNQKSINMNLANTFFKNPTGLDEDGHYSSAVDLARIAQELIRHPYLGKIVSTEAAVINSSDYSTSHPVTNINELLGHVPGVLGIKTGFTDLAGQTLVTLVDRNHHRVLIVLSGSTDRFTETKSLIDRTYSNFTWQ